MTPWLLAVGAGLVFAIVHYGWRRSRRGAMSLIPAILRFLAATLLVALLLDAPLGSARAVPPWVALDVSQSMRRGDSTLWSRALDSARAVSAESTMWFGDSARRAARDPAANDLRSDARAIADRALAAGRPLTLITDGEVGDPDAVTGLPAGSRTVVLERRPVVDVAISAVAMPRAIVAGDTALIEVTIAAGNAPAPPGALVVSVDARELARVPFEGLPPHGTRRLESRAAVEGPAGPAVVRAWVEVTGDVVRRNDTVAVAFDRSRSASAVLVSTSPDFDSRAAMGLLRGALALPARGFLRIAPGVWRVDGSLAPVEESEVRAALRDAPIAVIHGDSLVFGSPRTATSAPLALMVPISDTTSEWYVSGTPVSPLTPAFAGIGWDSLPPLLAGGVPARGGWAAVEASAGRTGAPRAIVVGQDAPRRSVTVVASGFWRWQFRGGAAGDAFSAFWGGVFDWLAGDRADRRAAIPDAGSFRAGESIRWRRGGASDSVVAVRIARRNGGGGADSLTLRFAAGATVVETPPFPEGLYEITVRGGAALLSVNPSAEWLPRQPVLRSGVVRTELATGTAPRLRDAWWAYAAVIGLLCAEWLLRRGSGLR